MSIEKLRKVLQNDQHLEDLEKHREFLLEQAKKRMTSAKTVEDYVEGENTRNRAFALEDKISFLNSAERSEAEKRGAAKIGQKLPPKQFTMEHLRYLKIFKDLADRYTQKGRKNVKL